jgi:putative Mg2+ transporter-C (MgtC) family protein
VDIDKLISDPAYLEMALRLVGALLVGAMVGSERSYQGRPAGFRTHALVCVSTALLMLLTVYEDRWFPELTQGRIALDPTRMAQGIMTGIGFLGAGTIMKDGLSVRGLTTAASIWITAAIGILVGVGFYFPAVLATILTFMTLSLLKWIENRIPSQFYAHFTVRFSRRDAPPEAEVRALLTTHGFSIASLHYHLNADADSFEYSMVIRASRAKKATKLAEVLNAMPAVKEFRVSPTGD